MKKKVTASVISQQQIAPDIYDMRLRTDLAAQARPGQFLGIYPKDRSMPLPRPISICEAEGDGRTLRIVYRVAGEGTAEFSCYRQNDAVSVLGVLGNGFPVEKGSGRKVLLMGGGIGIPPLLQLAKELHDPGGRRSDGERKSPLFPAAEVRIVAGYRDGNLFLAQDFEKYGSLYIATEDGSAGTKGNVMDAVLANGLEADVMFACGPMPMLRAVKDYAGGQGIPAYISLEEHMACGVGACLGCVVKTTDVDAHSHVHNARICTDGPVFEAQEVDI